MVRARAFLVLALFGLLCAARAAVADGGWSDADRAAIRATIESQLAAFGRDDGGEAFAYAAPAIRQKFGTAENFMSMVRSAYVPVYRPREVEFRDLVEIEGAPTQEVLVVGPDDLAYLAYYIMQRQADGGWRINGCILQRVVDRAV
jgi:hypothetical protein